MKKYKITDPEDNKVMIISTDISIEEVGESLREGLDLEEIKE